MPQCISHRRQEHHLVRIFFHPSHSFLLQAYLDLRHLSVESPSWTRAIWTSFSRWPSSWRLSATPRTRISTSLPRPATSQISRVAEAVQCAVSTLFRLVRNVMSYPQCPCTVLCLVILPLCYLLWQLVYGFLLFTNNLWLFDQNQAGREWASRESVPKLSQCVGDWSQVEAMVWALLHTGHPDV